jgi:hypothetical protein
VHARHSQCARGAAGSARRHVKPRQEQSRESRDVEDILKDTNLLIGELNKAPSLPQGARAGAGVGKPPAGASSGGGRAAVAGGGAGRERSRVSSDFNEPLALTPQLSTQMSGERLSAQMSNPMSSVSDVSHAAAPDGIGLSGTRLQPSSGDGGVSPYYAPMPNSAQQPAAPGAWHAGMHAAPHAATALGMPSGPLGHGSVGGGVRSHTGVGPRGMGGSVGGSMSAAGRTVAGAAGLSASMGSGNMRGSGGMPAGTSSRTARAVASGGPPGGGWSLSASLGEGASRPAGSLGSGIPHYVPNTQGSYGTGRVSASVHNSATPKRSTGSHMPAFAGMGGVRTPQHPAMRQPSGAPLSAHAASS